MILVGWVGALHIAVLTVIPVDIQHIQHYSVLNLHPVKREIRTSLVTNYGTNYETEAIGEQMRKVPWVPKAVGCPTLWAFLLVEMPVHVPFLSLDAHSTHQTEVSVRTDSPS